VAPKDPRDRATASPGSAVDALPAAADSAGKPARRNGRATRMPRSGPGSRGLAAALTPLPADGAGSAAEKVLQVLREAIIRSRIEPGTPLSETAVAEALGVSRTPVREALRRLAHDGLVRIYPQAATVIAPISLGSLRQACFIRRALECANIQDLALEISTRDLREIQTNLEAQRLALKADQLDEYFRLDEAMHRRLFEASGRELVWAHLEQIKQHLDRVRWLLNRDPGHGARSYAEHVRIFERLRCGDRAGAAKVMQEHIDAIGQDLMRVREAAPDHYFDNRL
jgi:DNA-binding GntR family transcriptional regulator